MHKNFPATIQIIVPWEPGQAVDLATRALAQELSVATGTPHEIVNMPGDSGVWGTSVATQAKKDGAVLLAASSGPLVATPLGRPVPYAVPDDFTNIAMYGTAGYVLAVRPGLGIARADELFRHALEAPQRLRYGVTGLQTTPHLTAQHLFKLQSMQVTTVDFKGTQEVMAALESGEIDFALESVAGTLASLRAGKVLALGTSRAQGSSLLPGVPSLSSCSAGLLGFDFGAWMGLAGPKGMSAAFVADMMAAVEQCLIEPSFRERMLQIGVEPEFHAGHQFTDIVSAQLALFRATDRA